MESWLAIVAQRQWESEASLPAMAEGEERRRRIAYRLLQEWRASHAPSHEASRLHLVDAEGEHTHVVFAHHVSSCHDAVDSALLESAGESEQTGILVLHWRGSAAQRAATQRRYRGGPVTPALYPSGLLLLDWEVAQRRVVHRRLRRGTEECSLQITGELHSKPQRLPAERVEALARELPSLRACARDNLAVGARPGDLVSTTRPSGEVRLTRVVEGEASDDF